MNTVMWWIAFCAILLAAVTILPRAIGFLIRRLNSRQLQRLCTGHLVLTYDDGPGNSLEPALLDLLAGYGVHATFFPLGRRAAAAPERCAAVAEAGHEMGTHGYHHVNAWRAPVWRAAADIRRGRQQLAPWLSNPWLFRPPQGRITLWTWLLVKLSGCDVVCWTHDSGDTFTPEQRPAVDDFVHSVLDTDGGVVLLHSFDRGDPDTETYVLEVTKNLLDAVRERGLAVSTVSEILRPVGHDGTGRAPTRP